MFKRAATDEMSCDSDWSAFSIPSKRNFRFHEDDDDTADIAERMPCSEDDDCNPYESGIVKRRSRQSTVGPRSSKKIEETLCNIIW